MPKKLTTLKVKEADSEASLLREDPYILSLDDRTALRAIFTNPVFKKALHNARLCRPSEIIPAAQLNSPLGSVISNNRIHQMQGWKMFEAALGRQVEDPKLKPTPPTDNYPDAGALP